MDIQRSMMFVPGNSDRMMTKALTELPAVGFPLTRSGGQNFAHWPLQVLLGPESFLKR